jgi:Tfp pilus assembly protein PilO
VNIRDIKLSSGKKSELNISCNAVTYRFVEAKETKKETKKKRGKRR